VRRDFFKDQRLRLGATWSRRENDQSAGYKDHNEILGLSGRYQWRGQDFMLEYGVSRGTDPNVTYPDQLHREVTVFRLPTGIEFPDRHVLQAEIKTLHVPVPVLGTINCIPTYWTRGRSGRTGRATRAGTRPASTCTPTTAAGAGHHLHEQPARVLELRHHELPRARDLQRALHRVRERLHRQDLLTSSAASSAASSA